MCSTSIKINFLGQSLQGIKSTAQESNHEAFVRNIKVFTDGICTLVEAAAQTAYLVINLIHLPVELVPKYVGNL